MIRCRLIMKWKEGSRVRDQYRSTDCCGACIPKLCKGGTAMGPLRLAVGLLTSLVKGSLICKDEIYVEKMSILKQTYLSVECYITIATRHGLFKRKLIPDQKEIIKTNLKIQQLFPHSLAMVQVSTVASHSKGFLQDWKELEIFKYIYVSLTLQKLKALVIQVQNTFLHQ